MAELVDALVLGTSANGVGVRVPSSAPAMYLFELTDRYEINQKWLVFFFCKKSSQNYNEMMVLEMKIIKQELQFEECLKQRLEFICEFSKVTPTFINGSIRRLEKK